MAQLERKHRTQSLIQFTLALALLLIVNVLANSRIGGRPLYGALDLTEDKRFTLTDNTVAQLRDLEEPLFVRVLLAGELPGDYQRLADKVSELLIDFSGENSLLEYEFADPLSGSTEQIQERQKNLEEQGVYPVTVYEANSAAERSSTIVYPYAIFYYGSRTRIVPFIAPALPSISEASRLNKAEALLEYNFSRAIEGLTNNDKPLIGFTVGNGELPPLQTADLVSTLREDYDLGPVHLDSFATIPTDIKLLVVAKPTIPFSDFQAFKLDQYIMNGGKVLWAIDAVGMDYDSLQGRNEFYPVGRELGLDNLFFKYGVRLSPVLGLDLASTKIGIVTGRSAAGPQVQMTPFPYHVMAIPTGEHPIIKNLDPVDLRFPTVIEEVGDDPDIRKTVLLHSSDRSRRKRLPAPIDLDAQKYSLDLDRFDEKKLPFAYLLEGVFKSPYANRLNRSNAESLEAAGLQFRPESVPNRMVVIADGDILVNPVRNGQEILPLGLNRWEKFQYANKAFMLNAIEYLLNPEGVISARGKEVKLRLIDKAAARADAAYWRLLNIGAPLLLLTLFGITFTWWRRRKYARKTT